MTNHNEAVAPLPGERPMRVGCALVFLLLPLFGLVDLARIWQTSAASVNWPTTSGVIRTSEIVEDEGASFAKIIYSYSVNGSQFESARLHVKDAYAVWAPDEALKSVRRFPVNTIATVHYNPTDPKIAVLEPGLNVNAFIGESLVIALFLFVGLAMGVSGKLRKSNGHVE